MERNYQTFATSTSLLHRQMEKNMQDNHKLETELNFIALDIQKHQESILELNNWIYLMNLVQSDQYSLVVNEIDKNLKVSESLRSQNQKLKKEILFQKKLQHDIKTESKRLHENISLEKLEMEHEYTITISGAKDKMQQTVNVIGSEVEMLRKNNEELFEMLKKRKYFSLYNENMEQIDELIKAKKVILDIFQEDSKK